MRDRNEEIHNFIQAKRKARDDRKIITFSEYEHSLNLKGHLTSLTPTTLFITYVHIIGGSPCVHNYIYTPFSLIRLDG